MSIAPITASILLACSLLTACSSDQTSGIAAQTWQGNEVRIESRPSPPTPGMNEFLVIVTGEHGRPAYDLVVSIRTSEQDSWKQAIQDGQVGVYRRAAEVQRDTRSLLQVQLRRAGVETVLRFPLPIPP